MTRNKLRSTTRWRLHEWRSRVLGLMFGLALGGCDARQPEAPIAIAQDVAAAYKNQEAARMWMTIGEHRFAITLADTDAARAFATRLPLTLDMADLNGNEKYADLREALPSDASRPGRIRNGDLMLYGSNTVVLFYETFPSTYSYTRLGTLDIPNNLARALGSGSVRLAFSEE